MRFVILHSLVFVVFSCSSQDKDSIVPSEYASIGLVGDPADVVTPSVPGRVLMGGGTDVDEAMEWMIERASGGDFVVIRASGSTGYNQYLYDLGNLNSVETLLIDSREKALRAEVGNRIREAEAIFIAGGDQGRYKEYWADTEVSEALKYLIEVKEAPIGGTSAGCAILSEFIFDAMEGTVVSGDALEDPYRIEVSISESFIPSNFMTNTLSDQHYSQRDRHGRHVTFLARLATDKNLVAKGIGVDERTAVCIDETGNATVYGSNTAYFIIQNDEKPETCTSGDSLHWYRDKKALRVYAYNGIKSGTQAFNLSSWPTSIPSAYWYVENGILMKE